MSLPPSWPQTVHKWHAPSDIHHGSRLHAGIPLRPAGAKGGQGRGTGHRPGLREEAAEPVWEVPLYRQDNSGGRLRGHPGRAVRLGPGGVGADTPRNAGGPDEPRPDRVHPGARLWQQAHTAVGVRPNPQGEDDERGRPARARGGGLAGRYRRQGHRKAAGRRRRQGLLHGVLAGRVSAPAGTP